MKKELCPFCKGELPKHGSQCFHASVPSAETIKDRTAKSQINDFQKLRASVLNQQKIVIDGGGNNLRDKIKK